MVWFSNTSMKREEKNACWIKESQELKEILFHLRSEEIGE